MSDTDPVALCPKLLRERFSAIFGNNRRAALIGFPEGQNCGQYANWLGVLKLLSEMAVEVVYASSWSLLDRDLLSQRIGDGVILFSNGFFAEGPAATRIGNVIAGFRNRIVFLPEPPGQGVSSAITTALGSHADLVILARDPVARQRAETALSANRGIELAPPTAFMFGRRNARPRRNMTLCGCRAPDERTAAWNRRHGCRPNRRKNSTCRNSPTASDLMQL